MIHLRPWLSLRIFGRKIRAPLRQCVHYGAFRYGRGEEHPYETYVQLLSAVDGHKLARRWLVDFVRYYRPTHMGDALGVALNGRHCLWGYPWEVSQPVGTAWMSDILELPDIITHYSDHGVPWYRIEQEFFWLESAYNSIRSRGFKPDLGPLIVARKLVAADGQECFLILDGNHRISALVALGYGDVELTYSARNVVRESEIEDWPQVRSGLYTIADARAIFRAYFNGNPLWRVSIIPAPLIGSPDWL